MTFSALITNYDYEIKIRCIITDKYFPINIDSFISFRIIELVFTFHFSVYFAGSVSNFTLPIKYVILSFFYFLFIAQLAT